MKRAVSNLAGVIGIAGVLAAGTALAARKSPVLPLQVPSSVITPAPEGNPYGLTVVPSGFPKGGIIAPGDLLGNLCTGRCACAIS